MERQNYVGVSGVINVDQQRELEQMFQDTGLIEHRVLQAGVKATHKTQYLDIENKYGREWYPVGEEIDTALDRHDGTMGVAQVCFDEEAIQDDWYRQTFIVRALRVASRQWLTGIQFDMLPDWCNDDRMHKETLSNGVYHIGSSIKDLTIAVQCHGEIMRARTPNEIARTLGSFPIDYLLFDASAGRGIRMDTEALLPYIEAVYGKTKVVVAGGLNADVVREELPKVLKHFPDVSWDAEGQLHPANESGTRPLDMSLCRGYIEASADVLR